MHLLLIRHATAAARGEAAERDEDRPLTAHGKERFRRVAETLVQFAPKPRALFTSPLLRARQTADLAAEAWGGLEPEVLDALVDGDWRLIRGAVGPLDTEDTVALVGHEGWMSELLAKLVGSTTPRAFRFRKGGVALVELLPHKPNRGTLEWFIPPRVLRKLG